MLPRLASVALTCAAGLAAAVPVIAATVKAVRAGWVPGADQAIIATRAYDVFTSHTPLVGQYTLAGNVTGQVTHSLGPMLFWLLALPSRFGGPTAMTVTMGAVNTLAIVGSVALARRRGGLVLMFMSAVAIALMCQSLAAETFHDVWNPSAGLFPFLLLIFVCWSLACGDYRLLPLAALLASFVVQAHLMYLPPTLGMAAVGLGGLALTLRRRRAQLAAEGVAEARDPAFAPGSADAARRPGAAAFPGPGSEAGPARSAGAAFPGPGSEAAPARGAGAAAPAGQPDGGTPEAPAQAPAPEIVSDDVRAEPAPEPQIPAAAPGRARLPSRRSLLGWSAAALLVLMLCWSAPVVDELRESPGNMTLVERSATARRTTLGASVGWHAVVRAVGIRPWWLYVPSERWSRKYDVRRQPSATESGSAIALLALLAGVLVVAAVRRRGDLAAGALIGFVLCAALAAVAASTPTPRLLSATLGYTMWWGTHLGMWIWLMLAWSAWLTFAWLVRRLAAGRSWPPEEFAPPTAPGAYPHRGARGLRPVGAPLAAAVGACAAALAATVAVGAAVAATEKPDEHQPLYRPTSRLASRLVRAIPRGSTVEMLGTLGIATMPIKPSLRYFLVRHGVRPLAPGSFLRLGDWYELRNRPYQYVVYVREGVHRPENGLRLLDRVHITDGFGRQTVSLWYGTRAATQSASRPPAVKKK